MPFPRVFPVRYTMAVTAFNLIWAENPVVLDAVAAELQHSIEEYVRNGLDIIPSRCHLPLFDSLA